MPVCVCVCARSFNTTFTTVMSFVATSLTPIMPIHAFAVFAAIVMSVNYLLVVFFTPAIIIIYNVHFADMGGCCCYCSKDSAMNRQVPWCEHLRLAWCMHDRYSGATVAVCCNGCFLLQRSLLQRSLLQRSLTVATVIEKCTVGLRVRMWCAHVMFIACALRRGRGLPSSNGLRARCVGCGQVCRVVTTLDRMRAHAVIGS